MRRYELMLLLRPDLEDDKLQAAVEKVTRAIVNGGGSLSKVSPWGKRRLAYDIGHHREASYFLIHFDIEPSPEKLGPSELSVNTRSDASSSPSYTHWWVIIEPIHEPTNRLRPVS